MIWIELNAKIEPFGNYKSDKVDALIRDTARTNDQVERLALMTQAHDALFQFGVIHQL